MNAVPRSNTAGSVSGWWTIIVCPVCSTIGVVRPSMRASNDVNTSYFFFDILFEWGLSIYAEQTFKSEHQSFFWNDGKYPARNQFRQFRLCIFQVFLPMDKPVDPKHAAVMSTGSLAFVDIPCSSLNLLLAFFNVKRVSTDGQGKLIGKLLI